MPGNKLTQFQKFCLERVHIAGGIPLIFIYKKMNMDDFTERIIKLAYE